MADKPETKKESKAEAALTGVLLDDAGAKNAAGAASVRPQEDVEEAVGLKEAGEYIHSVNLSLSDTQKSLTHTFTTTRYRSSQRQEAANGRQLYQY